MKQVTIITGAAAGIGRGVAMRFGRDGYIVVIADVNAVAAGKVVSQICELGGEAVFRHCDVTGATRLWRWWRILLKTMVHSTAW